VLHVPTSRVVHRFASFGDAKQKLKVPMGRLRDALNAPDGVPDPPLMPFAVRYCSLESPMEPESIKYYWTAEAIAEKIESARRKRKRPAGGQASYLAAAAAAAGGGTDGDYDDELADDEEEDEDGEGAAEKRQRVASAKPTGDGSDTGAYPVAAPRGRGRPPLTARLPLPIQVRAGRGGGRGRKPPVFGLNGMADGPSWASSSSSSSSSVLPKPRVFGRPPAFAAFAAAAAATAAAAAAGGNSSHPSPDPRNGGTTWVHLFIAARRPQPNA